MSKCFYVHSPLYCAVVCGEEEELLVFCQLWKEQLCCTGASNGAAVIKDVAKDILSQDYIFLTPAVRHGKEEFARKSLSSLLQSL